MRNVLFGLTEVVLIFSAGWELANDHTIRGACLLFVGLLVKAVERILAEDR